MAKFTDFIAHNVAGPSARKIVVFNPKGMPVGTIALGKLTMPQVGEKLYSFGALSDVHITYDTAAEDFSRALTYLNEACDVAFTCISGDLTETGVASELAEYKRLVDAYSADTPVYAISGNHEATNGAVTDDQLLPYTGQPLYYSFTHEDDVFVMCGEYAWGNEYLFAPGQLQWLYDVLEANRNKRCFVFFHVFPWGDSGNAGGLYAPDISYEGNLFTGTQGSIFQSLMTHYKNVTWFHGHSHLKFDLQELDEKANYSEALGFRSVHIPSLAMPRDANAGNTGYVNVYADSEGYVVDVYEQGIHLRGRDFVKEQFLPIASYWLDTTLKGVAAGTYQDDTGTIVTYREIPYIETTGEQYIDTGFVPDSNTRIVADFVSTGTSSSNNILGCRSSTSSKGYALSTINNNWRFAYNASVDTKVDADKARHTVEIDKNVLYLDGVVIYTADEQEFTTNYSLCLGAINYRSPYLGRAKFYSCQIYDDGTLVRDLVPCILPAGETGMYDKVNDTFYGNAGTGTFITSE